jgi:hypothetical protein
LARGVEVKAVDGERDGVDKGGDGGESKGGWQF